MNVEYDYIFKIVFVGDGCVGKSALLLRFIDDIFVEIFNGAVGVDFRIKWVDVDGKTIKLQIWDTIGNDRFRVLNRIYYRHAAGIIIVYDVTERRTFDSVKIWLNEVNEYANDAVCKILVGNKCDLTEKRVVEYAEAKEFADSLGIPFIETSAKNSMNVERAILEMATRIKSFVSRLPNESTNKTSNQIDVSPSMKLVQSLWNCW